MVLLKLLLGIVLCLWCYILWTRRKFYKLIFQIPGPLGYPLLGIAHKLINREEILYTFEEFNRTYGSVFFTWLGPLPILIASDPQIAQDILTSPSCVNKGQIYKAIDDGLGYGLFSLKNPEWSRHRKLLNPAFGHKVLLSFMPIFNDEVAVLLENLDSLVGTGEIDLTQTLQKFTLNVAAQTTMGTHVYRNEQNEGLLNSYHCSLEMMAEMCFSPWLSYKFVQWCLGKYEGYAYAKKDIRNFIKKLIDEKLRDTGSTNNQPSSDVVDRCHKNIFINLAIGQLSKGELTLQNVEDESNGIVFGAFETTANTFSYILMLLAMFPIYQKKAFDEIVSIFPESGNFDVSYEDTQQMVYMDLIINETMRVLTPVPIVVRETSDEMQLSNGTILPKGIQVAIDIFHIHRRTDIWGAEANVFNPENFLPSNLEGKHAYAFMPFTKGIRNCIGWKYALMSIKVALAKVIRNYYFTTKFNFEDLQFVEDITIKMKQVPLLEIHKRDN